MNHILAMLFGIIGSIQIHISKCFQLHGIETLRHFKEDKKVSDTDEDIQSIYLELENKKKKFKRHIYLSGIILSNSAFIWIMLANKYAPASYFTSMFGFGMIILLIYAGRILKEKVTHHAYWGALLLIIGMIFIGLNGTSGTDYRYTADMVKTTVLIISAVLIITAGLMFFTRKKSPNIISLTFGFSGGALACFDPLFKSIGQTYESVPGLLPNNLTGWIFFILSLFFTTSSFIVTQWAFTKNVRATMFIPIFNSVYILFPMVIMKLILPGFGFTIWGMAGIILIIIGMFIMREVSKYEV